MHLTFDFFGRTVVEDKPKEDLVERQKFSDFMEVDSRLNYLKRKIWWKDGGSRTLWRWIVIENPSFCRNNNSGGDMKLNSRERI
jgi:hypothetical protein